jgi:hypothetical protein
MGHLIDASHRVDLSAVVLGFWIIVLVSRFSFLVPCFLGSWFRFLVSRCRTWKVPLIPGVLLLCWFVTGYPIRIVMSAACILASIKIGEMSVLVWFGLILSCYFCLSVCLKKLELGRKVADLDDSPLSWFPLFVPLSICRAWIDFASHFICTWALSSKNVAFVGLWCNYVF